MVEYLNWTTQFMTPQQVAEVKGVAISVNPNNTPAQATAFLTKNKAVMPITFLLGSQAQLSPLWKAYYIEVEPGQTDVGHTSGPYVLDQQGRERVWLDGGFDPKDLSGDLKSLLAAG
jgi:protein SCO1